MTTFVRIFFVLIFLSQQILPLPAPIFYQSSELMPEPWFEIPWLTNVAVKFRGGVTDTSFNGCGDTVSLFEIYGIDRIQYLAQGAPQSVLDSCTSYLPALANTPILQPELGNILFTGNAAVTDISLELTQNFTHGLYSQVIIPFRRIRIGDTLLSNNGNQRQAGPAVDWQEFVNLRNNLTQTLCCYGTTVSSTKVFNISDLQLLLGWTRNDDNYCYLDYIDYSLVSGVFFPTCTRANPFNPLSVSTGYNKHWAIPLVGNLSIGAYNWLTIYGYLGGLFLFKKNEVRSLATSINQQGFIRLTHGQAAVKPGNILQVGGTAKADHVVRGFSLLLGAGYDRQAKTNVFPCDPAINSCIANQDPQLQPWSMVTLHVAVTYDNATYDHPTLPLIAFSADLPVAGTRIFKNDMLGFAVQITVNYCW